MRITKSKGFYADAYLRNPGVTGSSTLISVHWPDDRNKRFLVDDGAAQGRENKDFYNAFFPFNAGKIDFIILTHTHHDHQGLLPLVVRQGFQGPIFTHYANTVLMTTSLYDSCKIADTVTGRPLCDVNEVEATLDLVVGCTTKKILKPDKNIKIVFYANGHLVGAVITLVVISCPGEEDITLLFTGDFKDRNIFFNVETPPKEVKNLNISAIFCESTYGNVDSTNPMFDKCLQNNTVKALKEGKTVLYAAYAQGRYQEVLYDIKMWKKRGIIPQNTLVYADGKASQENTIKYMYNDLGIKKIMKDFVPTDTKFVPRTRDRMEYRRKIMENNDPKIIIAPGGMASYGPIQNYIQNYISRNDVLLHLLGYCSEDSQGYRLLNTPLGEKVKYAGKEYVKWFDTKRTGEKSGHAPRNILLAFLEMFPNKQSIIIYHGENETKHCFREFLLDNLGLPEDQIVVSSPDIAYRIESNGITDRFETHLDTVF